MNAKPNTEGINRYWKKGEDDRVALAAKMKANPRDEDTRKTIDGFLDALMALVKSRRRTKFVGFGVFEWKPWNNRIPSGERVKTWRLTFKPGRYVKGKYNGTHN